MLELFNTFWNYYDYRMMLEFSDKCKALRRIGIFNMQELNITNKKLDFNMGNNYIQYQI